MDLENFEEVFGNENNWIDYKILSRDMGLHQSYLEFIQNNQIDAQSRMSMKTLPMGVGMSTQFKYYAGKNDTKSQCMSQRDFLNKANRSESGDLARIKSLNSFRQTKGNISEENKISEKIKQATQMMQSQDIRR